MKTIFTLLFLGALTSVYAGGSDDHSHSHEKSTDHHHEFAFGQAASASEADKVIDVIMDDNTYDLASLIVKSGETIHFKIVNVGQQIHEFTIATVDMHIAHQDEMLEHINAGHMSMTDKGHGAGHDHANSLLLNPGESGELTWKFAKAENLEFACNVPGHYHSGMKGMITVQ